MATANISYDDGATLSGTQRNVDHLYVPWARKREEDARENVLKFFGNASLFSEVDAQLLANPHIIPGRAHVDSVVSDMKSIGDEPPAADMTAAPVEILVTATGGAPHAASPPNGTLFWTRPGRVFDLLHAAVYGPLVAIEALTRDSKHIHCSNEHGHTALMAAASCGHLRAVELLLRLGADTSCVDKNGHDAAWWATEQRGNDFKAMLGCEEHLSYIPNYEGVRAVLMHADDVTAEV
jgi:ankyrin repeat protein